MNFKYFTLYSLIGSFGVLLVLLIFRSFKILRCLKVHNRPYISHGRDRVMLFFLLLFALSFSLVVFQVSVLSEIPECFSIILGIAVAVISIYFIGKLLFSKEQIWEFVGVDDKFRLIVLVLLNKCNIKHTDNLKIHLTDYNLDLEVKEDKNIYYNGRATLRYSKSFNAEYERAIIDAIYRYYSKKDPSVFKSISSELTKESIKAYLISLAIGIALSLLESCISIF